MVDTLYASHLTSKLAILMVAGPLADEGPTSSDDKAHKPPLEHPVVKSLTNKVPIACTSSITCLDKPTIAPDEKGGKDRTK